MATKTTAAKKTAKKSVLKFPRIYVGDSVTSLGLKRHTIYRDGYSDLLKSQIKQYPLLGKLIVPISKLQQARLDLQDSTSALYVLHQKFLSEIS